MGTILERKRKDGSTGYHAQIVIRRDGAIAHRETKTFDRRPAASAWIKKREHELAQPGAVERAKIDDPTLAVAIQRYVDESSKAMGRTKAQVLRTIQTYSIAEKRCSEIASPDLVGFARELANGRTPQTVANYLAHLGAIFAVARPAWGYPLDEKAMKDAAVVAKRLGVTSKSRQRDRRPTREEMDRLLAHFDDRARRRPGMAPMCSIVAFALFSTRRLDEITRITWTDLDEANARVMVRDMKNPGEKAGNDVWVDLPPEALAIVRAQGRNGDRIFPHSADAIGANFTRGAALLGIKDLHFHDLRHEGVSRLFEQGKSIPHVAAVSGHRSWVSLKRYTHLRSSADKWEGWPSSATAGNQPQLSTARNPEH